MLAKLLAFLASYLDIMHDILKKNMLLNLKIAFVMWYLPTHTNS